MILVPESWGTDLREYNTCHDPATGRFCSGKGGAKKSSGARASGKTNWVPWEVTDKGVIKVKTVEAAVELILAGKDVELSSKRAVNTVIEKLAEMANEARALGRDAPHYDLCRVSVRGTNVFCAEKFRSKKYPEGVPRVEMPQMGGKPVPGSEADKLPKNANGEVNGAQAFIEHLRKSGIKVISSRDSAARLKASQAELVGPKVAGMMTSKTYDPAAEPIFVSRDDYVIDGHHRWAATVGRDAADNRLGGFKMKTYRVDAPISRILRMANQWAVQFGIAPKAAGQGASVT